MVKEQKQRGKERDDKDGCREKRKQKRNNMVLEVEKGEGKKPIKGKGCQKTKVSLDLLVLNSEPASWLTEWIPQTNITTRTQ